MLTNLKKRTEGFTIIEVMIVLAIAGLIMLIVFLAVPALQRNSRNTQRKNDASAVLSAVGEFVGNSNGTLPASAADQTLVKGNAKYGFYEEANVSFATGAQSAVTDTDTVLRVVTKAKCGTGGAAIAGAQRQYVIQYAVETGSGTGRQSICQEG
jgi:prepilin-type N-terminal cleavage/methylation domain-containing protein